MDKKVGYDSEELRGLLVNWVHGFRAEAMSAGAIAAVIIEGGILIETDHRTCERRWVFSISREAAERLRHRATRVARVALDEGEDAARTMIDDDSDEGRDLRHRIVIRAPKKDDARFYERCLRDDIDARGTVDYLWGDENVERLLAEGVEVYVWDFSRLEQALPHWNQNGFVIVG